MPAAMHHSPAMHHIPTDEEILALHERHAPSPEALGLVYTHCEIVCRIAEQFLARRAATDSTAGSAVSGNSATGINADLVRAGALLHDIGVYRLYDDAGHLDHAAYIRHGVLGHELLREAGFSEQICRFASHHTGVGISRDDVLRQGLPLPPADYLADTREEALVMYSDKFHSKTTPPTFLTPASYAASVRRYGADKAAAFEDMRAQFGDPDLTPLARAYGQTVSEGHSAGSTEQQRGP